MDVPSSNGLKYNNINVFNRDIIGIKVKFNQNFCEIIYPKTTKPIGWFSLRRTNEDNVQDLRLVSNKANRSGFLGACSNTSLKLGISYASAGRVVGFLK